VKPVVVCAGGTGGHLFPAEALARELAILGRPVHLVSDERVDALSARFPAVETHVVSAGTVTGRGLLGRAAGAVGLAKGMIECAGLLRRFGPAAVVGFGGYPTVPPLMAASVMGVPTVIHEANAVMGRANRFLAPRMSAIATGYPLEGGRFAARTRVTGNPVREAVIAAARQPYDPPRADGPLRLLVFGGSQGARVMSEVAPQGVLALPEALRARLSIVQQARPEDRGEVVDAYARAGVPAQVESFFADLPARIAQAHLVIARGGASTVAELAVIGRPSLLVPLPGAIDQDQAANARALEAAGGAVMLPQPDFTPRRLAELLGDLAADPARLAGMAENARRLGAPDAARRLAEMVLAVAA
jgi:UDP-N-acetylglucosamine--N-acetylmuramyl-(pentapeptide) pyrophosphoryl-undecaprenol N-acetylglucosamine transferase